MSEITDALFNKYAAQAEAVTSDKYIDPKMPLPLYIRESFTITQQAIDLWSSGPDGQPGLQVAQALYTQAQTARHRELLSALAYATTAGLIKPPSRAVVGPLVERGDHLCDEIEAACAFILDDGVEDADDASLASLQGAEDALGAGVAARGQLLLGFVSLADLLAPRLATLGDWSSALLEEARKLGAQLITAAADNSVAREEAERIQRIQRGLLSMAHEELAQLRKAASYVWRNHPATRQRFFSAIERTNRARRRAAKAAAGV